MKSLLSMSARDRGLTQQAHALRIGAVDHADQKHGIGPCLQCLLQFRTSHVEILRRHSELRVGRHSKRAQCVAVGLSRARVAAVGWCLHAAQARSPQACLIQTQRYRADKRQVPRRSRPRGWRQLRQTRAASCASARASAAARCVRRVPATNRAPVVPVYSTRASDCATEIRCSYLTSSFQILADRFSDP